MAGGVVEGRDRLGDLEGLFGHIWQRSAADTARTTDGACHQEQHVLLGPTGTRFREDSLRPYSAPVPGRFTGPRLRNTGLARTRTAGATYVEGSSWGTRSPLVPRLVLPLELLTLMRSSAATAAGMQGRGSVTGGVGTSAAECGERRTNCMRKLADPHDVGPTPT